MSVVLATSGDFADIAATVYHLSQQSIVGSLELVLVAHSTNALRTDHDAFRPFWGHQVIGVSPSSSVGDANAAGVRAARAAVVALAEDHCFPEPGWAEALLDGHDGRDVAAVGPVMRNANPGTLVSWCDFVIGYGPWLAPGVAGDRPFLPGHNSSYRRDVLLSVGTRLPELMAVETVLHTHLRARGYRLTLAPEARAAHTNFALLRSWLPVQYHCGRAFAAERVRTWTVGKRVLYALGSPLIPWIRLGRALRQLRRAESPRPPLARLGPLLLVGLTADGIGQLVGCVAGKGTSPERLARYEFRRSEHVPRADRVLWSEFGAPRS
jgi:hypothetical protein